MLDLYSSDTKKVSTLLKSNERLFAHDKAVIAKEQLFLSYRLF